MAKKQTAETTEQAAGFTEVAPAEVKAKKKREKKEKVARVLWGERDADGNLVTKIPAGTTVVEGFDPAKHLPLRRKDFVEPIDHLAMQIAKAEENLAKLKKEFADEQSLGSTEQRKKAKQAKSLKDRLAKITGELKDAGMTDDQIAQFLS